MRLMRFSLFEKSKLPPIYFTLGRLRVGAAQHGACTSTEYTHPHFIRFVLTEFNCCDQFKQEFIVLHTVLTLLDCQI